MTIIVYRVPQMRGTGHADVLVVLQVPENRADEVPRKQLQNIDAGKYHA